MQLFSLPPRLFYLSVMLISDLYANWKWPFPSHTTTSWKYLFSWKQFECVWFMYSPTFKLQLTFCCVRLPGHNRSLVRSIFLLWLIFAYLFFSYIYLKITQLTNKVSNWHPFLLLEIGDKKKKISSYKCVYFYAIFDHLFYVR